MIRLACSTVKRREHRLFAQRGRRIDYVNWISPSGCETKAFQNGFCITLQVVRGRAFERDLPRKITCPGRSSFTERTNLSAYIFKLARARAVPDSELVIFSREYGR